MTDLILQMTAILIPIAIYQMFRTTTRLNISQKLITIVFSTFSIVLCMSYSVPLHGYHYDMRNVPLFLAILYGGTDVGLFVSLVAVVYRFYIGGLAGVSGSIVSTLIHLIVLPVVFWVSTRYPQYSHEKRVRTATWLGALLSVVAAIIATAFEPQLLYRMENWEFNFWFVLVNTLGLGFVVFLIEKSREAESLKHKLQEAEKLRVVSHLAASVAHEIRNPLTVVRGFIQLITQNEVEMDKRAMYGRMIIEELDRAESIISDYLTFARPEVDADKSARANVATKIRTAVNVMQPYARVHDVAIETDLADDLYIRTEKQKFIQVVINLLKNGIEAMPKGGTIRIVLRASEGHAVMDVIDNGMGMSKVQIENLGYPFYSTKEQGTGLGLMVCYRIIQSIGGEITVTSKLGKGTQFRISVPLEKPSESVETASMVKADQLSQAP